MVFVLRHRKPVLIARGFLGVALSVLHVSSSSAAESVATTEGSADVDEAASLNVQLVYEAPVGCGDRREVLRRTQQLLAGPKPQSPVSALVVVRPNEGGLKVIFEASREGGQSKRELVVSDCAAAIEASALLLMLTLDPVAAARATALQSQPSDPTSPLAETAPEPEKSDTEPAAVPQAAQSPRERPEPTPSVVVDAPDPPSFSRPLAFGDTWVGFGAELVTGLSPAVGRGLRLDAGTTIAGIRFGLSAAYDWVSPRPLPQASFASVDSQLYRLRAWGGPAFRAGVLNFGPQLALGMEHLRAEVGGISNPTPGAMTWLSGAVGGLFDVHLAQTVAIRVQAAAVFSLERRTFTVRRIPGIVHRPDAVGVEASGGLVWVWGAQ